MGKIVIEKLGKNYCVFMNNKTSKHVVFYSTECLSAQQAFFECRDVGIALKIALKHKDTRLYYTDLSDAAGHFGCEESELLKFEEKKS